MKHFIFYTQEGYTEDNTNNPTENCQVLGWSKGETSQEAFESLLKENQYIKGFHFSEVLCQELMSTKTYYFSFNR